MLEKMKPGFLCQTKKAMDGERIKEGELVVFLFYEIANCRQLSFTFLWKEHKKKIFVYSPTKIIDPTQLILHYYLEPVKEEPR